MTPTRKLALVLDSHSHSHSHIGRSLVHERAIEAGEKGLQVTCKVLSPFPRALMMAGSTAYYTNINHALINEEKLVAAAILKVVMRPSESSATFPMLEAELAQGGASHTPRMQGRSHTRILDKTHTFPSHPYPSDPVFSPSVLLTQASIVHCTVLVCGRCPRRRQGCHLVGARRLHHTSREDTSVTAQLLGARLPSMGQRPR